MKTLNIGISTGIPIGQRKVHYPNKDMIEISNFRSSAATATALPGQSNDHT